MCRHGDFSLELIRPLFINILCRRAHRAIGSGTLYSIAELRCYATIISPATALNGGGSHDMSFCCVSEIQGIKTKMKRGLTAESS